MFNMINNRINRVVLAIILAFFVVGCFFSLPPAQADGSGASKALSGLNTAANEAFGENQVVSSVPEMIGKVVGAALSFIGVIFFLLMIYGGFNWMTARGNEQEVTKAKELIYAAVIGLAIVLAAYAITSYIGSVLIK